MKRERILLVEDHPVNRAVIIKILSDSYEVVEAENGRAALDHLASAYPSVSGILLDLLMPVMNGLEFLKVYSQTPAYANIPVLVATSAQDGSDEKECLKLGAWDFIRKPIDADLLKLRLKNTIGRSQNALSNQIRHMAEHDELTGLYNRKQFLSVTRRMLDETDSGQVYALIHVDVKRFRLVNSFFGASAGDALLKFLAEQLREQFAPIHQCTLGRLEADVFCACAPLNKDQIAAMAAQLQRQFATYRANYYQELSFGVYCIADRTTPVEAMCDCAGEAAKLTKNGFQSPVVYYQQTMSEAAVIEQKIMSEAQAALDSEQFEVYLQPKYDLARKCVYGAEALARWKHPARGLISPGQFIPIFEKNGFIAKLDFYMWERTCRLLRKWSDAGLNPDPVSVNISRVNMYNPHLVEILRALVGKYSLSPSLLNLELTESAYMDNPEQMKKTVEKLKKAGFVIMMDDFGSGYSSLNTLKDVPIDVLKVDMRFLPANSSDSRSERILASVIRMAGWLGLDVIVEGVETKGQLDFLESVGCGYVQGFYFAKPMPAEEYEVSVKAHAIDSPILSEKQKPDNKVLDLIWSSSEQASRLFDSIMNPLAVFEFGHNYCNPMRVNTAFRVMFGALRQDLNQQMISTLSKADTERIINAFRSAAGQRGDAATEFWMHNSTGGLLRCRLQLRYIQDSGNGVLLMALFTTLFDAETRKDVPLPTEEWKSEHSSATE